MSVKILQTAVFLFYSMLSYGQGTWTEKAPFSPGDRHGAVGFSIADKGYIATGGWQLYIT